MIVKTFSHSLGRKGFEVNIIGKVWNLRIASRQFALWRNYESIFNFCNFG